MTQSLEAADPIAAVDRDAGVRVDVLLAASVVIGVIVLRLLWLLVRASGF